MTITWLGQACFKIQTRATTIIIDPYDAKVGFELPKCHADIVLVTHGHFDHANSAAFQDAQHVITEPGDYDLDGIAVKGISTYHDAVQGRERGLNTIYTIESEGLTLLHMGDFGETEVRLETIEAVGHIDILMIPVGGTYTIDGAQAALISKQINSKIVIPMHYLIEGLVIPLDGNSLFLDTSEGADIQHLSELEITKKDLNQVVNKIIVLSRAA